MGKLAQVSVIDLKVNYITDPVGIDTNSIRFSWRMESDIIGQYQTSYRIIVHRKDISGSVIWDSGVVAGSRSSGIAYKGIELAYESGYCWQVIVCDKDGNEIESAPAYFETGTAWDGVHWIVPSNAPAAGNTYTDDGISKGGAPYLRTNISLKKEVQSARLYITSLGAYEAYINGTKLLARTNEGDYAEALLAPGWTDYKFYTNYQTYDITESLRASGNGCVLGVKLYRGWYAGTIGNGGEYELIGVTGAGESTAISRQLALIAKVQIRYTDGTEQTVKTNSRTWKSIAGPVTRNEIYTGEDYDANIAEQLDGWNMPGYNDTGWHAVSEYDDYCGELRAGNAAMGWLREDHILKPVSGYKYTDSETIYPAELPPAEGMATPGVNDWYGEVVEHPIEVNAPITLHAGEKLIVDMSQNMVGLPVIEVSGPKGAVITIRHAEMLNDGKVNPTFPANGGGSDGPRGTLHYRALRDPAAQTLRYTLSAAEKQTYRPSGTFLGFRYIEIAPDSDVTVTGISGIVATSVGAQHGSIETSDENVNRLFKNVLWGEMGNFFTLPTDCPQRNERLGWTGDAQVFAQTALYNFNTVPFYDNYSMMLDENCMHAGSYGEVTPTGFSSDDADMLASGWSDAGVIIPWTLYRQTGDVYFLKRAFPMMDAYMENVHTRGYDKKWYGDWLAFSAAHIDYMNAVYHIYMAELVLNTARILGYSDMISKYSARLDELRAAFMAEPEIIEVEKGKVNRLGYKRVGGGFVYANGDLMSYGDDVMVGSVCEGFTKSYMDNAQTALLWSLKLGLYRDEEHKQYLINKLVENIRNKGRSIRPDQAENTLSVGFLGVNVLLPVLSMVGANSTAYDLLLQDELPSWLYCVKHGATTIWERWNSYSHESFGAAGMNSFNHFSYGACAEWMYEYMAGISREDAGFNSIVLQPVIDVSGRITHATGSYDSILGKITSAWQAENGKLASYAAVIPANTTARLYLPVSESAMEGFADIDGISYTGMTMHNGIECACFELVSGGCHFTMNNGRLVAEHC